MAARRIPFLVLLLSTACDEPQAKARAESGNATVSAAATSSAPVALESAIAPSSVVSISSEGGLPPRPSASAPPGPDAPLVRQPPSGRNSDADNIDECLQSGGNYFSCGIAFAAETDAVWKRYLFRLAQAQAAGVKGYGVKRPGPIRDDIPHAEAPASCDPRLPCGAIRDHNEINRAQFCLARAFVASAYDPDEARASHLHACRCEPEAGKIWGYNGSAFYCDDHGKPAFLAPNMKQDEAKDILACGECHPKNGPPACRREIERLQSTDAGLAEFVKNVQIRRCQTPNTGPESW